MQTTITKKTIDEVAVFAQAMGQKLRGGETIELISDVGGGKTTFVKGLVKGAGSHDHVSSPTFKISNVYKANHFDIYHFDFYRLPEAGLIAHELAEIKDLDNAVIVVEWSDVVAHVLSKDRLKITISVGANEQRIFSMAYPKQLEYLVK